MTVTPNPPGQNHVLLLDCDSLGMHAAKICIFEEADDVGFSSLLHGDECLGLEAYICAADLARNLSHEALKGCPRQQTFHCFLIAPDLPQRIRTRLNPLLHLHLHSTFCWRGLLNLRSL